MSFDRILMGVGFSAGQALGVDGFANLTVTAAGTTQATATQLQFAGSQEITTASAGQGVIIPVGVLGDNFYLANSSGTGVFVYPVVGTKFNALPTNQPFVLANNSVVEIMYFSATKSWVLASA